MGSVPTGNSGAPEESETAKKPDYLWRTWVILVSIAAVFLLLYKLNPAEEDQVRKDALTLMKAGLWPLGVAAYCSKQVTADPGLRETAGLWSQRNQASLKRIVQAIKASGDMTKTQKTDFDREAYREVKRTVESQKDKAAYCAEHARALRAGEFDLDNNPAAVEALRRLSVADLK